jgi:hypothetical protein
MLFMMLVLLKPTCADVHLFETRFQIKVLLACQVLSVICFLPCPVACFVWDVVSCALGMLCGVSSLRRLFAACWDLIKQGIILCLWHRWF